VSAGCGDDASGPGLGNLVVITATTGADADPSGYTVTVNNTVSQNIGTNASVTFSNLTSGDYTVELTGLEDNCSVNGTNPRTVNVGSNGGTTTFDVVCNSLTGNIEVITSTTGVSIDPDGYTVEVDSATSDAIGVNDTITVDDQDVGDHSVELTGLAANCTVSGDNPRTVTVPDDVPDSNGGTVQTTFAVNCVPALGNLTVATSTTGTDVDPNGYTVTVDGSINQSVGTNGNVTFTNLGVGDHTVLLTGIAANCTVTGSNPRTVGVQFGDNNETFDVTCEALGEIVFDSDRDGNREIYIMPADGSIQQRLTGDAATDRMPVFSPDNSQIAFSSDRDGGTDDIWVMNKNGAGLVQLTSSWRNIEPAWSPDGTQIAFTRNRNDVIDVHVMNTDGSNVTNLTNSASSRDDQAEWSPDGSKLVFRSNRDGGFGVWVMNSDGSGLLKLTNGTSGNPTWSPDGTKIAFVSDRSGNLDIWVMDANGANQVNVTMNPAQDGEPAWNPTSGRITFSSDRDGNPDIYAMDADGTNVVRLTNSAGNDLWPSWSRQ